MKNYRSEIDTSKDLTIHRYKNGIRLARPHQEESIYPLNIKHTVGNILTLPYNVYFYDTDAIFLHSSESNAELLGFDSINDCIGKSVLATCTPGKSTKKIIYNNQEVLKNKCIRFFEEDINRIDNVNYSALTIKSPWYNEEGKIKGVFGCSIALGIHSLANALEKIAELGLLPQTLSNPKLDFVGDEVDGIYFSKREIEVIRLSLKGQTARTIADKLCLSKRTIEHYINNAKIKLNVNTKAELLDKIFHHLHIDL